MTECDERRKNVNKMHAWRSCDTFFFHLYPPHFASVPSSAVTFSSPHSYIDKRLADLCTVRKEGCRKKLLFFFSLLCCIFLLLSTANVSVYVYIEAVYTVSGNYHAHFHLYATLINKVVKMLKELWWKTFSLLLILMDVLVALTQ